MPSELLKPYDARMMRGYPPSPRINHVANDDEECSAGGTRPDSRSSLPLIAWQGVHDRSQETSLYCRTHRLGFCRRVSQCLNPKTFLMCNWYSPARRFLVTLWMRTVTSGTGRFIPLRRRRPGSARGGKEAPSGSDLQGQDAAVHRDGGQTGRKADAANAI
jgi:hypothetical protein